MKNPEKRSKQVQEGRGERRNGYRIGREESGVCRGQWGVLASHKRKAKDKNHDDPDGAGPETATRGNAKPHWSGRTVAHGLNEVGIRTWLRELGLRLLNLEPLFASHSTPANIFTAHPVQAA